MPLFNSKIRMSLRLYQQKSNKSATNNCKVVHHPTSSIGKENNCSDIGNDSEYLSSVTKKAMEGLRKNGTGVQMKTSIMHKGGDMKYNPALSSSKKCVQSAISEAEHSRESSASSYSFESCLVDSSSDDDDNQYSESFTLDEKEASPDTKAIMAEMEQVYDSTPIPNSYLNSPPTKTQVLPEIVLHPNQISVKEKAAVIATKRINGGLADRLHTNGPSATAKVACGGSRRNSSGDVPPRRTSTAPINSGGTSKSLHEWDMPTKINSRSVGMASASAPPTAITKKPAALAVQREEQQRNQRLKDAMSASNKVDGRRNLDKRTARLRFGDSFKADITQYRQRHSYLNNGSNHSEKVGSQIQDRGMNGVSIAVRKRPMFDYELDRGDYDIISIDNTNERAHDVTIVHNCVMHADMKQMLMKPISYPVTAAFDEHARDDDIYRHIAEPLVLDAANQGIATILMYGQTGCGKSHTMSGIETRTSHGIFKAIESMFAGKRQADRPHVTMQFVELCGSKECRDLLVKESGEVKLLDSEDGSVQLLNAVSLEVTSPEELLGQILLAKGRRATEATDKNGVSSRSHAVCQIQIKGKHPGSKRGLLTLIDCAGSERSHDSLYHSSERQKESAEINASLYALKECIRARAKKSAHIPFRSSNLTRILKESFERAGARLCVIACVAPNATDTEHTMDTLKTVASIVGVDDQIKEEKAHSVSSHRQETRPVLLPPTAWNHKHLQKFLVDNKMHKVQLAKKHDGKTLMKMSVLQMRAQLFEDRDKEQAQKLFDLLRKENDRVTAIQRKERAVLMKERKERV